MLIAVVGFGAHDAARAFGVELRAKYDPLHRLRGWQPLGRAVTDIMARHPGAMLMSDDREVMAALIYYVRPHPFDALKWNGEGGIHDEFDLNAEPSRYIGDDFVLISKSPDNVERILKRFASVEPVEQQIMIRLDRATMRTYKVFVLHGFEGYRSSERTGMLGVSGGVGAVAASATPARPNPSQMAQETPAPTAAPAITSLR